MNRKEIERLAGWYCKLNCWNWPKDLPGRPRGWDAMQSAPGVINPPPEIQLVTKYTITSPTMALIKELIGEKECSRYWWRDILNRSDKEFEEWWNKKVRSRRVMQQNTEQSSADFWECWKQWLLPVAHKIVEKDKLENPEYYNPKGDQNAIEKE